jgi:2-dehydropantoate 2-reductase
MRILVVGAGATGGYFGARLAQAGRDVTFLVRPARAEQLRTDGLQIVSPHGDLRLEPRLVDTAQLFPEYDVVLLAVKAFALEAALDDVAPAVGPATMVLPFLNGMRHIDVLTARFGERPILGGVCLVATTLDTLGRILQLGDMQQLVYGERDGTASPRVAALDGLMQGAGFAARSSPQIMQEMWEKWVMLATLGGITCLLRGNVGEIEAAPGGADLALTLLAECGAVATAAGYPPRAEFLQRVRPMLTQPGSPLASSMYRDLQQGRRVEADQILGDLAGRARAFAVPTPILAAAFTNLCVYDTRTADAKPAPHAVA